MRIRLNIEPLGKKRIALPQHYNYLLQGFLYRNFDRVVAEKVHNEGYQYAKRNFRLFTFSRLFGKFQPCEGNLIYEDSCSFWIASPIIEILESVAGNLARKRRIKIGSNYCHITSIEVGFEQDYGEDIFIRVLSPITIYSTLLTGEKKKKTYYYSPFEADFSRLARENLLKKYILICSEKTEGKLDFLIAPEKVSKRNEHIIFYKETVIKAWSGIYQLKGSRDLIKLAFDCGLGAKNSQGFGMIEKYNYQP